MGAAAVPVMIGATILSTAAAAYGTIQAGRAAEAQAQYQSQVAKNNAIIAEHKAKTAEDIGAKKEAARRQATELLKARQRTTSAARGVLVDAGSALDITADTAAQGEFEALLIRDNAARQAAGFRSQAAEFSAEAELRELAGRDARRASLIGAGGQLLQGATTVAAKWYEFNPPQQELIDSSFTPNPINRNRLV